MILIRLSIPPVGEGILIAYLGLSLTNPASWLSRWSETTPSCRDRSPSFQPDDDVFFFFFVP